MPTAKTSTFTNLTPERLEELADREDCVVYKPTHDVLFAPWPAQRVRECVKRIVKVSKKCASEEDARAARSSP